MEIYVRESGREGERERGRPDKSAAQRPRITDTQTHSRTHVF